MIPLIRKRLSSNVINVRRRLKGRTAEKQKVSIATDDVASRVFKIYGRLESFADKDLIRVID